MKLKVGDLLIFIGNKNLQNNHYNDNFEIGKSYQISRLENIAYDIDEVSGYNSECVLFENHKYGCLISNLKDYFVTIEDYRNNKIDEIIDDTCK
jgi:hypothetical protein